MISLIIACFCLSGVTRGFPNPRACNHHLLMETYTSSCKDKRSHDETSFNHRGPSSSYQPHGFQFHSFPGQQPGLVGAGSFRHPGGAQHNKFNNAHGQINQNRRPVNEELSDSEVLEILTNAVYSSDDEEVSLDRSKKAATLWRRHVGSKPDHLEDEEESFPHGTTPSLSSPSWEKLWSLIAYEAAQFVLDEPVVGARGKVRREHGKIMNWMYDCCHGKCNSAQVPCY